MTSLKLIFFVYTNVCKTETKRIHLRLAPDNDAKETGDKYGWGFYFTQEYLKLFRPHLGLLCKWYVEVKVTDLYREKV